jgi:hypothetical protein
MCYSIYIIIIGDRKPLIKGMSLSRVFQVSYNLLYYTWLHSTEKQDINYNCFLG